MRRRGIGWLLGGMLTLGACTAATTTTQAAYSPYSIRAEDTRGRALRTFYHRGELFVLGRYGERYNLRVTNHTGRRVEAVVTVDGRDVISGKKGDTRQRGYLVGAYDSVVIEGFRTSLHGVAAFRFTDPGDSYSSRMGSPENVGIIGAAFFPEKRRPRRRPRPAPLLQEESPRAERERSRPSARKAPAGSGPGRARAAAPPADADRAAAAEGEADTSNLGTRYGEHRHSEVREVRFRRAHPRRPSQVLTMRYDNARGLLARGIQVYPPTRPGPVAFPMSGFAPPPPR